MKWTETNPYVADVKEQQKALLMQVMQLTDEQINALAPEHRDQIRQLVSVCQSYPVHCYPYTSTFFCL